MNINALIDVGLLGRQEQPLEIEDFATVNIRDSARTVGRVLKFGIDRDRCGRIHTFRSSSGAHAGSAASHDYNMISHLQSSSPYEDASILNISNVSFTIVDVDGVGKRLAALVSAARLEPCCVR